MIRWLVVATTASLCACGPSGAYTSADPCAGPTPEDVPSSCPTPAPTYSQDVLPILERTCLPCHSPQWPDEFNPPDLAGYDRVYEMRGTVQYSIAGCWMPDEAAGGVPLTEPERQAIMGWIVCGAPDD